MGGGAFFERPVTREGSRTFRPSQGRARVGGFSSVPCCQALVELCFHPCQAQTPWHGRADHLYCRHARTAGMTAGHAFDVRKDSESAAVTTVH